MQSHVWYHPYYWPMISGHCRILHDFGDKSFYGESIRLVVCGYIRPEANFPSLDALVARIHRDGEVTREALEDERLEGFKEDGFLNPVGATAGAI
jgi:hypothetical protein